MKREKIELENTLEKEQESLVNRLWKRMEKLETDKRLLQLKLEQPDQTINSTNIVRIFLFKTFSHTNSFILKKKLIEK